MTPRPHTLLSKLGMTVGTGLSALLASELFDCVGLIM